MICCSLRKARDICSACVFKEISGIVLSAMSGNKFRGLCSENQSSSSRWDYDAIFSFSSWLKLASCFWILSVLAFRSSSTMSLTRLATLEEQTGSNRSPSRSSFGKDSVRRWRLLNRPWLKHRSNSAPEEPLDMHDRRILVRQDMRTQSLTWSRSSSTRPSNPPISRVHSLPDPQRVTSRGVLLEHANLQKDWLSRSSSPFFKSTSELGSEIHTGAPPLRRVSSSHMFSGILLSMSRRISRILNTSPEPAVGELSEDGRKFDLCLRAHQGGSRSTI